MDWNAAVDRNRESLKRILAMLIIVGWRGLVLPLLCRARPRRHVVRGASSPHGTRNVRRS